MSLYLPRRVVQDELIDQINAEVDQQIERARYLERELKSIDQYLSVVLVSESADPDEFDYPGYWHLRKEIPGSAPEFFPLRGDAGERLDPGPWILDWLQARDLWNPRVHRSRKEAKEKLRTARARAKRTEAEQRQDEGLVAARAAKRLKGPAGMRKRMDLHGKPRKKELVLPAGVEK